MNRSKCSSGFLEHGGLGKPSRRSAPSPRIGEPLTDSEKVQRICAFTSPTIKSTQSLDPRAARPKLKATLVTELSEEDYYLHPIVPNPSRIQNRVSPILKAVTFLGRAEREGTCTTRWKHFRLKDGAIDKNGARGFF